MLPVHRKSLLLPRRLHSNYEFGSDPKSVLSAQYERNKRNVPATSTVTAKIYYPNQNKPASNPGSPPTTFFQKRDWHKKGSLRLTVSNRHLAGQDDDLEPDAYHILQDGYNAGKQLYTDFIAAFPSLSSKVRVMVEARGFFNENVVFDSPYVDVIGIGWPIITADPAGNFGDFSSVVTVTKDCTKIEFGGFRILNGYVSEGLAWMNAVGLMVEEGNENGGHESDIRFYNLQLQGGGTQAYFQRRVFCLNVRSQSLDNFDNTFANEASIITRYCPASVGIDAQRGWNHFIGCHISGQEKGYIKRGKAMSFYALQSDLSTIILNNDTIGAPFVPTTDMVNHSRTGNIVIDSEINGWTENLGWVLQNVGCKIVQGQWINDTGSGGCHHFMTVDSDSGTNAYSYFENCMVSSNYLANCADRSAGEPTANAYIWVWQTNHNTPTNLLIRNGVGGSMVKTGLLGLNATNVSAWIVDSTTHCDFYYEFPALTEGAIIVINGSFSNAWALPALQRIAFLDLYQNIIP